MLFVWSAYPIRHFYEYLRQTEILLFQSQSNSIVICTSLKALSANWSIAMFKKKRSGLSKYFPEMANCLFAWKKQRPVIGYTDCKFTFAHSKSYGFPSETKFRGLDLD